MFYKIIKILSNFVSEVVKRCQSQQEVSRSHSASGNQRASCHECLTLDEHKISNEIKSQVRIMKQPDDCLVASLVVTLQKLSNIIL